MSYKNLIFSSIFFIAIGLAAWLTLSHRSHHTETTQPTAAPDAYMEGVTATIMNKQGKISMVIVTPKVIHYEHNDRAMFTNPQLTIYRKSPRPWFVTSLHASTSNGLDQINFWDDVIVHHSADQTSPATLIKTTQLTVHPTNQTAETDQPITLIQPNITVNGTGMFANMSTGSVKLLKQARGEYVPS